MARSCLRSSWLISAVALSLLLPLATRSQPIPVASETQLPTADQKDSYEIYSMLLKTEMPPQWKIAEWTIQRETRTFYGQQGAVDQCLVIPHDQESIYRPLVQDYVAKNGKKFTLERKFDLPDYALIGQNEAHDPIKPAVTFHVSADRFQRRPNTSTGLRRPCLWRSLRRRSIPRLG